MELEGEGEGFISRRGAEKQRAQRDFGAGVPPQTPKGVESKMVGVYSGIVIKKYFIFYTYFRILVNSS